MKRTIICILIIIIVIAAAMYYSCWQRDQFTKEKELAIAEAVQHTIDSLNQRRALETPEQHAAIHKPPPTPAPAKKKAPPMKKVEPKAEEPMTFTDERDGKVYKIFEANGIWWMGQNLDYETPDSWCYDLEGANCDTWGRLYTWDAATTACPPGWHLPNDKEWAKLISHYGGVHYAGKELKEGGASGFNAEMSGYRDKGGFFGKGGVSSYYWSATEQDNNYASFKGIYSQVDNVGTYTYTKPDGLSVRCIKDSDE
jgi:uncharacterized protein (TIGR02145 family)